MLAKRTFKNQITIPKAVIKDFPHAEYFDVTRRQDEIVLRPVDVSPQRDRLAGIRAKIKRLGLTEQDVEDAVRWARRSR